MMVTVLVMMVSYDGDGVGDDEGTVGFDDDDDLDNDIMSNTQFLTIFLHFIVYSN